MQPLRRFTLGITVGFAAFLIALPALAQEPVTLALRVQCPTRTDEKAPPACNANPAPDATVKKMMDKAGCI